MNIQAGSLLGKIILSLAVALPVLPAMAHVNTIPGHIEYNEGIIDRSRSEIQSRIKSTVTIVTPTYNSAVESYLKTYLERNREHTEKILGRSAVYFPMMEKILRENNMPTDLKYLAIIESALKPWAVSRVGATGMWQFMKPTAREFGLSISKYVDERQDPEKSTRAAVKYMKWLYGKFGNWELVMAAYNAGPGRIRSAMRRSGKSDYYSIAKYLPRETRSYVPGFIAASYVSQYYYEHGLSIEYPFEASQNLMSIRLFKGMSFKELSDASGISFTRIAELNAKYTRNYIPQTIRGHDITLPDYGIENLQAFLEAPDQGIAYKPAFAPIHTLEGAVYEDRLTSRDYIVRRGDNLYNIAKDNGVTISELRNWNSIVGSRIDIGQRIKIFFTERVMVAPPNRQIDIPAELPVRYALSSFSMLENEVPVLGRRIFILAGIHQSNKIVLKRRIGLIDQLKLAGVENVNSVLKANKIDSEGDVLAGRILHLGAQE